MSESTARLGLPLLVAGQGQKDVTHNEALLLLDAAVAAVAERRDLGTPPDGAEEGQCWLVPEAATGAWAERTDELAILTTGGWRFLRMPVGAELFVKAEGQRLRRGAGGWEQVVPMAVPAPAIAAPEGGATVDMEARQAIGAVLTMLRASGLLAAGAG